MFRHSSAVVAALLFSFSPALAQDSDPLFLVELNKATEKSGACEIVMFARNGLSQGISNISLKFAVVDKAGQFNSMLSLPLGAMRDKDSKFASYTLQMPCAELSKIVINDVVNCTLKGAGGPSDLCSDQMEVNSREPDIEMAL